MTSDDMFDDSGGYRSHHHKSREITPEELQELERRARKEGKRDIILSQLVDQQAETVKTLREVNIRLAHGDRDIERLDEEHKTTIQSMRAIGEQASEATQLMCAHVAKCDERWDMLKEQIDQNKDITDKYAKKNPSTVTQTIIANVISGIIIAAIMGGLMAYFVFIEGSNQNSNTNSSDNIESTP